MKNLKTLICKGGFLALAILLTMGATNFIGDEPEKTNNEVLKEMQQIHSVEPIYIPLVSNPIKVEAKAVEVETKAVKPTKEEPIEYDPPETIYDYFTKAEIEMLERLVEAEATAGNLQDKINVANVIYNRLNSSEFPDTIKGVVFQRNGKYYQFSCIPDNRYYEVKVTKETKKAVKQAFEEKDTTKGALFFCNVRDVESQSTLSWFKSLDYIMTDDIGHSYYK